MFILIFSIWLLLNSYFALDIKFLEIVLFGLLISSLIYLFMIKFTKWTFKTDIFFIKHIHLFIAYSFILFINVIQSNLKVIFLILKPGAKPTPQIIVKQIDLHNELLCSILANSITLTPGTITITYKENKFVVHCLKKEFFDGFENSSLVKILKKMEDK